MKHINDFQRKDENEWEQREISSINLYVDIKTLTANYIISV